MPRKRRAQKGRNFDDYRRQQLLEGPDASLLAGMGYFAAHKVAAFNQLNAEQQAEVLATMREDWALFGPGLMEWWRSGEQETGMKPWTFVAPDPGTLPWAAYEFGQAACKSGGARFGSLAGL